MEIALTGDVDLVLEPRNALAGAKQVVFMAFHGIPV